MRSGRHWVRTWMRTSSGIRSSEMMRRTKSKSGWLADGKPTSISLKPICTSVSNIFSLRAGSIGSMSAWLPSRRSTAHHRGARSIWTLGQRRSESASGSGRKGTYLSNGIFLGLTDSGGMTSPVGCQGKEKPPGRKAQEAKGEHRQAAFASHKQEDDRRDGPGRHDEQSVAVPSDRAPAEFSNRSAGRRRRGREGVARGADDPRLLGDAYAGRARPSCRREVTSSFR